MYDKIVNPATGKLVNVNGPIGQHILRKYASKYNNTSGISQRGGGNVYDKIQSPLTDKWVNVDGKLGQSLLKSYVNQLGGGAEGIYYAKNDGKEWTATKVEGREGDWKVDLDKLCGVSASETSVVAVDSDVTAAKVAGAGDGATAADADDDDSGADAAAAAGADGDSATAAEPGPTGEENIAAGDLQDKFNKAGEEGKPLKWKPSGFNDDDEKELSKDWKDLQSKAGKVITEIIWEKLREEARDGAPPDNDTMAEYIMTKVPFHSPPAKTPGRIKPSEITDNDIFIGHKNKQLLVADYFMDGGDFKEPLSKYINDIVDKWNKLLSTGDKDELYREWVGAAGNKEENKKGKVVAKGSAEIMSNHIGNAMYSSGSSLEYVIDETKYKLNINKKDNTASFELVAMDVGGLSNSKYAVFTLPWLNAEDAAAQMKLFSGGSKSIPGMDKHIEKAINYIDGDTAPEGSGKKTNRPNMVQFINNIIAVDEKVRKEQSEVGALEEFSKELNKDSGSNISVKFNVSKALTNELTIFVSASKIMDFVKHEEAKDNYFLARGNVELVNKKSAEPYYLSATMKKVPKKKGPDKVVWFANTNLNKNNAFMEHIIVKKYTIK